MFNLCDISDLLLKEANKSYEKAPLDMHVSQVKTLSHKTNFPNYFQLLRLLLALK